MNVNKEGELWYGKTLLIDMKFQIKSNLLVPEFEEPDLDRYFLNSVAQEMIQILKREIRRESFKSPPRELLSSWDYRIRGKDIIVWSDHPALTGEEELEKEPEEEPEETLEEAMKNVDLPEDPAKAVKVLQNIPNVIVVQDDGSITVRKVTAKKLGNDEWMFPPHRKTAFLERANKAIMGMISNKIKKRIQKGLTHVKNRTG